MKKTFAILLSAVLLMGLLAGCGNQAEEPTPTNNAVNTPVAAGMLVVYAGAAVNISYDADGLVLNVEGADDNGSIVAGEYPDFLGKPTAEAVCDVIAGCAHSNFLTAENGYVLIKQAYGSALPGATFLETISADAASTVKEYSPAKIVLFTEEKLDEQGYINLEAAKELLLAHLVLDSFDTLEGTTEPIDGQYSFAVTAGDMEARFIIDAVTGNVFEGELDDVDYGDEMLDEEIDGTEPIEDIIAEDTTAASNPQDFEESTEPEEEPVA